MQTQSFSWTSFANLGGIAGFLSLAWQIAAAVRKRSRRPVLHARAFDPERDLGTWQINEGPIVQKVATVEITNIGKSLASRCVASATVLRSPAGVRLRNAPIPLKWAGTDPTPHDTGTFPIDLGTDDHQRLDVVFTRNIQTSEGCWLAAPLALFRPEGAPQFHLPPGTYDIEVVVRCTDGDTCRVGILVDSPRAWEQLNVRRLT